MQLNLGCGTNKIRDCINADCNPAVNPDIVFDMRHRFPFNDEQFDSIYFFHTIEHIQRSFQPHILFELRRILRGKLWISYPEFSTIAQYWLENKYGKREFWEATIYGRQNSISDYHVTLMDTDSFCQTLQSAGFKILSAGPEPTQPYNTILLCEKSKVKPITYEELLKKEIFS